MLEWPRRMNGDPSKQSKHQILTLPPWSWTWHKEVLWYETTNRDPCRPREVAANWSNPARRKTNSPRKRHFLDDNHPTRETWWAEATSPLEYRMPEEYILYLRLKKEMRTTNTAYPSKISSRYYQSSKLPRWRTIWEMINSSREGKHVKGGNIRGIFVQRIRWTVTILSHLRVDAWSKLPTGGRPLH